MSRVSTVQLGGELSGRSILGGNRNRVEWLGMSLCLAALGVILLVFMEHPWIIAIIAPAMFGAVWLWSPRASMGHRSPIGRLAIRGRWHLHRRQKRLDYAPETKKHEDGHRETMLPGALGKMRMFEIDLWPGEDNPGRIMIQRQLSHGQVVYVATFEFRTRPSGLMARGENLRNHQGWADFQASLARQGSLVRYLQQVSRIVPYDPSDHTTFVVENLPANPASLLVESYAELLDTIGQDLQQNRTWLTVGIPRSGAFNRAVSRVRVGEEDADDGTSRGDRATQEVLRAQLRTVVSRARAEHMALRPLSMKRYAGVVRALQDPDQPIDRMDDVDQHSMWQAWNASDDPGQLRIKGSRSPWYTRTALVSRDGFSAGKLPVDLLVPLLTGVTPSVTRTISSHFTLIPAPQAREEARRDVTTDHATIAGNARYVSDGTAESQISVSRQRLSDLAPSSGVHGADQALAITIQARTPDELEEATNLIEEAAADSHITSLTWQDHAQHLALPITLPMATGLQRRKVKA